MKRKRSSPISAASSSRMKTEMDVTSEENDAEVQAKKQKTDQPVVTYLYDSYDHSGIPDKRVLVFDDGATLEVSSSILSLNSSYFNGMFNHGFLEEGKDTVEMKKVTVNEMLPVIRMIYDPTLSAIDVKNIESVAKVADQYSIVKVLEKVEASIMTNCTFARFKQHKRHNKPCLSLCRSIAIAVQYNMSSAKKHLEDMLLKLRFHTFLKQNKKCVQLNEASKAFIFTVYSERIIEEQQKDIKTAVVH